MACLGCAPCRSRDVHRVSKAVRAPDAPAGREAVAGLLSNRVSGAGLEDIEHEKLRGFERIVNATSSVQQSTETEQNS